MRSTRRRITRGMRSPTRSVRGWASTFPTACSGRARRKARAMSDERRARSLRGLYAITPEVGETERLVALVRDCIASGAAAVQYRAKALSDDTRHEQALRLRALCRARGVPLIVNDSVALALAVDADGVHLGRDDGDVSAARAVLGHRIVGVSCYDELERARAAAAAGARDAALGSGFPPPPHTRPG